MKIVVKVEIDTLTSNGVLDKKKTERLAMVLTNLRNSGINILLVSSGSIFLGAAKLGLKHMPEDQIKKQAVSAVGQVELMKYYRYYFDIYNQVAAQVLLTSDIINNPVTNRNVRNTLKNLLSKSIIPVINENDSVSTDDIELNDNYYMVLNVAEIINAELILVKLNENGKYRLIQRGKNSPVEIIQENRLIDTLKDLQKEMKHTEYPKQQFPRELNEISS
jgi:glutamate 5-kinase